MQVTIELPDTIAQQLQQQWQDLPRCVLEGLALKGYCARVLTTEEVRRLLEFETRFDVHDFLAAHGVPIYTLADLEHNRETSQQLGR
jgi:hypothetical protein